MSDFTSIDRFAGIVFNNNLLYNTSIRLYE
jgi:hypothetical protein